MTTTAEIRLPSDNLHNCMPFYEDLGFRLNEIYPADDPSVALMSGHGLAIRLVRGAAEAPGTIILRTDDPDAVSDQAELTSPAGVRVEITSSLTLMEIPQAEHSFVIRRLRDRAPWVIGRAGMNYRDLIPDRLGGAIIASHIRILDEGPVPDMVHYHTVGFQLIFCHEGWVDLVYEDQGPAFRLDAGDCVIQPPGIRHRVLHSSDNLEVVEIGVPAEHITTIDHDMDLPTPHLRPEREFGGQVFVHHKEAEATWADWRLPGWTSRDTGIATGTRGVAGVHVARGGPDTGWFEHNCDILFSFVRFGTMVLQALGKDPVTLEPGDAFVIPPGQAVRFVGCSEDLEVLEVALGAEFGTLPVQG